MDVRELIILASLEDGDIAKARVESTKCLRSQVDFHLIKALHLAGQDIGCQWR